MKLPQHCRITSEFLPNLFHGKTGVIMRIAISLSVYIGHHSIYRHQTPICTVDATAETEAENSNLNSVEDVTRTSIQLKWKSQICRRNNQLKHHDQHLGNCEYKTVSSLSVCSGCVNFTPVTNRCCRIILACQINQNFQHRL